MRGHLRSRNRRLTQRSDTTKLVTTRTSWFWKHFRLILFSIFWLIFIFCWLVSLYPISLVSSDVDVKMFSPRNKKQQSKRLLSQLSESDTGFMIGQNNQSADTEGRGDLASGGSTLNNINDTTQTKYPQVDVHTLEKNIVSKVRSEIYSVMTTVQTSVQDAVLTAGESLVVPRVELAMKSANASSGQSR